MDRSNSRGGTISTFFFSNCDRTNNTMHTANTLEI